MHTFVTHSIRMGDVDGVCVLIMRGGLRSPSASGWVSQETDPESRISVKNIYLGSNSKKQQNSSEEVRQEKKGNQ